MERVVEGGVMIEVRIGNRESVMKTRILVAMGVILFSSCGHERGGCEGNIVVENTIPDLILYVGDDPYRRDVFESPVVLRHTLGRSISILVVPSDGLIVEAARRINTETGRASIVEVIAQKEGNAVVEIEATDECFDRRVLTRFNVTVLEISGKTVGDTL